jgi:hypothetical protein
MKTTEKKGKVTITISRANYVQIKTRARPGQTLDGVLTELFHNLEGALP